MPEFQRRTTSFNLDNNYFEYRKATTRKFRVDEFLLTSSVTHRIQDVKHYRHSKTKHTVFLLLRPLQLHPNLEAVLCTFPYSNSDLDLNLQKCIILVSSLFNSLPI